MRYKELFDVIVVGGGHAGTEAACAAARMGASTLLLTHNIETIGQMSCNPAIGGIGKGHLVKEIDAMGGIMARAVDKAAIQLRILNASKGPAVRATRAQADRALYKQAVRAMVEQQDNLKIFQQAVDDLIVDSNQSVEGVVTQGGIEFMAKTVILTVGTFLGGKIHVGLKTHAGGRAGDPPSIALAQRLRALPFRVGRLKTGTPPRIASSSIDYSLMTEQHSDAPLPVFSFSGDIASHPRQVPCHITHTNSKTHDIIRRNLDQAPMFTGAIEGAGPRYCPSIEDKIFRFAAKDSHQIFIEPEGLGVDEVYPNGISTSLPFAVQLEFVRSMVGLENAHITRAGYAIEYDYFDPRDLHTSLETKIIKNLFFAGQINGTTGYEEAAAQGLLAGINAACMVANKAPWLPRRSECYLGVLVDDLTTMGALEPYRMFTSRAEYRLLLREDNADLRLSPIAHDLGLLTADYWQSFCVKRDSIVAETERLKKHLDLLKRPEMTYASLVALPEIEAVPIDAKVAEQVEIQVKYAGYIARQSLEIARNAKNDTLIIPVDFNYTAVSGFSNEITEKLTQVRPGTLGQAARIPGVTPAAISLLLITLKKQGIYKLE